jgi:exonuclease VII large subunit
MHNLARYEIQHLDHRINHLLTFINSCSPQNVLQQGYTLVQQHGKYITASQQLNLDEELTIHFHDGTVNTKPVTKHRSSHD